MPCQNLGQWMTYPCCYDPSVSSTPNRLHQTTSGRGREWPQLYFFFGSRLCRKSFGRFSKLSGECRISPKCPRLLFNWQGWIIHYNGRWLGTLVVVLLLHLFVLYFTDIEFHMPMEGGRSQCTLRI